MKALLLVHSGQAGLCSWRGAQVLIPLLTLPMLMCSAQAGSCCLHWPQMQTSLLTPLLLLLPSSAQAGVLNLGQRLPGFQLLGSMLEPPVLMYCLQTGVCCLLGAQMSTPLLAPPMLMHSAQAQPCCLHVQLQTFELCL